MLTWKEQIRIERTRRGWTQRELATRAGVDHKTVNRAERAGDVTVSTLEKICDALELTLLGPVDAGLSTVVPDRASA